MDKPVIFKGRDDKYLLGEQIDEETYFVKRIRDDEKLIAKISNDKQIQQAASKLLRFKGSPYIIQKCDYKQDMEDGQTTYMVV